MLKITKILCYLSIILPLHATATTAKDKTLTYSVGGCATGFAVGAYLNSKDDSDSKSSQATLGINTALGCLIGMGWSYLFVADDQENLAKQRDKYKFELEQAHKIMRQEGYRRLGAKGNLRASALSLSVPKDFDFAGYRESGCQVATFRLMNNNKKYVPVNQNIVLPNVFYYLVSGSKDKCVKQDYRLGVLDQIIPNLGSVLHDLADDASRDALNK